MAPTSALAATEARPSEAVFIAAIVLLLVAGRLLGEFAQRIGQPAVTGQLIAGIVLGPSVLGSLLPQAQQTLFPSHGGQHAMVDAVGQLGVLMLLLLTGMETDLVLVRRTGRAAISASIAGIAVPFACGFLLGEFLPEAMLPRPEQRLVTALLIGTALSISSVKIVAMVVREMNFLRRNIGQIIVASAIIDDTLGWIIIGIVSSLAGSGVINSAALAARVLGTALFLVASFTLGRRLVVRIIRWTNDTFVSEYPVITAILVIMGIFALITDAIGVSTVLGAFVAGALVGQSPILTRHIDDALRGLISGLFMPIFFGLSGMNADLRIFIHPEMLALFGLTILIASFGKFAGAFIGGRIGGLTGTECLALASAMNARGSTEVIVATIGLSIGALTTNLFTMIVGMAVVTTTAMPPMLRWALRRLPMGAEEQQRLAREAVEAASFLSKLERLLLVVDDSAKGSFAARLAGLLAKARRMPVTVLRLGSPASSQADGPETIVAENVHGAEAAASDAETPPGEIDITTIVREGPPAEAIPSVTKRGHDLLLIGIDRVVDPRGGFSDDIIEAARSFAAPLAIAAARGVHAQDPRGAPLDILVPITGAEVSRRGAEVALALASAAGAPVTALQVARPDVARGWRSGHLQPKEDNAAVQREIQGLAEHYAVTVRTLVRVNIAPEDAILRQARLGGHNLIVMGVSRWPGETLSFGHVAAAILESAERSLLFVAPGT